LNYGQGKTLELLPGSEKLGYDSKSGAHRLVGTVNFVYQGNTMYCDSAHYFDKQQRVKAFGKVHIVKDAINLYCDSLDYNGKTKKAKLWGHVRVRDQEYKLSTDSLDYDAKKGRATYTNWGKIESISSKEVIKSKIGYFYPDTKDFFFSGKVQYKNEELSMTTDTLQYRYAKQLTQFFGPTTILRGDTKMFCERGWFNVQTQEGSLIKNAWVKQEARTMIGDTLLYQPQLGKSIGKGHVELHDTLEKTIFYGDYAVNSDTTHSQFLTGHVLARKINGKDTLYVHADTLFNQNDTLNKGLYTKAFHSVKVFNSTVQAVCDSLYMNQQPQVLNLFYSPILWSRNAELKGDTMRVFLNDSVIERVEIRTKSSVVMELDSGTYYNQVAGQFINAYFQKNELIRTDVRGNAQTVFFPEEELKTDTLVTVKRKGMNRLYSSDINIYLDSGEVTGITYLEKPDGVFYPMNQINKDEQFIPSFKWNPMLRPKSWEEIIH
jgi:lipopolysaccharide assembly outer membrane protein LptD (OstA)